MGHEYDEKVLSYPHTHTHTHTPSILHGVLVGGCWFTLAKGLGHCQCTISVLSLSEEHIGS
jgi:hypothetical protein